MSLAVQDMLQAAMEKDVVGVASALVISLFRLTGLKNLLVKELVLSSQPISIDAET